MWLTDLNVTDTTSTTLTYLFWELARNPTWQQRLRDELSTVFAGSGAEAATWNALQKLPVLDAIVNEALRLHPAVPASLPRTTPIEGRILNGYQIPGGVSQSNSFATMMMMEKKKKKKRKTLMSKSLDHRIGAVLYNAERRTSLPGS